MSALNVPDDRAQPRIELLGRGDEGVLGRVAEDVFDGPIRPEAASEFLSDARHHIAVALDGDVVVGFSSAVHYVHPDKPPELWVNEVGVAPAWRRKGLATALIEALFDVGRRLGCLEAWVLTEQDNGAARRLYRALGGEESSPQPVMVSFHLDEARTGQA